jgi:hypothetical protein
VSPPLDVTAALDRELATYRDFILTTAIPDVQRLLDEEADETEIVASIVSTVFSNWDPLSIAFLAGAAILMLTRGTQDV